MASKKGMRNLVEEMDKAINDMQKMVPGTFAHYKGPGRDAGTRGLVQVVEIIENDYLEDSRATMGKITVKTSAGDLISIIDPWFLTPIDPLTQLALEAEEEK